MIVQIRSWVESRSARERRLLLLMLAILVPVLIWLILVRPLSTAYDDALQRHLQAVDRNGRVKALAASGAVGARTAPRAVPDLALFLGDSARQRAITAEVTPGPAPGTAVVTIASSAAPAALDWLRGLETAGYRLGDVRLAPSGAGAISVTATVSGGAR